MSSEDVSDSDWEAENLKNISQLTESGSSESSLMAEDSPIKLNNKTNFSEESPLFARPKFTS